MEMIEGVFSSTLFWVTFTVFGIYLYLKYVVYNLWGRLRIPHDAPTIPLGNLPFKYLFGKTTHGIVSKQNYDKFKKHRFHGLYMLHKPVLVITDPELIQLVLVKNFHKFYNRGTLQNENSDPLSTGLVRLLDEKWKRLRGKLTPTFTSGKLKLMYPLIKEICDEFHLVFDNSLKKSNLVEIKDPVIRFTIDCISSIAFGYNCNSLKNPDNDFLRCGKISNHLGRTFVILTFFAPELAKHYPLPEIRRKAGQFFVEIFEKMVDYRKKNKILRNDFLNLLIQLMDYGVVQEDNDADSETNTLPTKTDADKLSMAEAVGQAAFFFAAGSETTSSAICCCLYELAFEQEVQEKLYEEISEVARSPGGLTYEKLFEMKYLDMVFNETLRKHPGAPILNRFCNEDFDVPNSNFRITKGMKLTIPIKGLHLDPDIYPEPEKFIPERFLPENKAKRHPFTFIPFGEGPKMCIGKRLGILKPKMALFHLLLNYKFSVCDKTPKKIRYTADYFIQVPDGDIFLKVEKRTPLKAS